MPESVSDYHASGSGVHPASGDSSDSIYDKFMKGLGDSGSRKREVERVPTIEHVPSGTWNQ